MCVACEWSSYARGDTFILLEQTTFYKIQPTSGLLNFHFLVMVITGLVQEPLNCRLGRIVLDRHENESTKRHVTHSLSTHLDMPDMNLACFVHGPMLSSAALRTSALRSVINL